LNKNISLKKNPLKMGDFIKYIDWYSALNKNQEPGKASKNASVKSKQPTPKRSVSKASKKSK
jgi:hypothetical protein